MGGTGGSAGCGGVCPSAVESEGKTSIAKLRMNLPCTSITQFPTLEQKRLLRDLRSGKVKQICVLVAEDEYVNEIR